MVEAIAAALRPIRNSLLADGFDIKVEGVNDGVVSVVVFAGPEACLECLIPEEHFKLRIEDRVKGLVERCSCVILPPCNHRIREHNRLRAISRGFAKHCQALQKGDRRLRSERILDTAGMQRSFRRCVRD